MFDWRYVSYHLVADITFLTVILLLVSWIQRLCFHPVLLSSCRPLEGVADWLMSGMNFSHMDCLQRSREKMVCFEDLKYSPLVSLILWFCIIYGSSFILHLPSMWKKRVQLAHPFVPLDPSWYENLHKPIWTPPSIAFAVVWLSLKSLQSYALALTWEVTGRTPFSNAVILMCIYLVLADLFNQVFFVQHDITGALVIMVLMLVVLVFDIVVSFQVTFLAAVLLCPLLGWMLVAFCLQFHIMWLNGDSTSTRPVENTRMKQE
eukprot:jgi/Galph1/807/GphlegSOOS_G5518.1